jgi:hypothetical protein
MGLYVVKVFQVFAFATRSIWDKDGEGVSSWIHQSGFVIGDPGGPKIGKPIVCVLLTVGVSELWCKTWV